MERPKGDLKTSRRKFIETGVLLAGFTALSACVPAPAPTPAASQPSNAPTSVPAKPAATRAPAQTAPTTAPAQSPTKPTVAAAAGAGTGAEPKPTSINIMTGISQEASNLVLPDLKSKLGFDVKIDIFPYSGLQQKSFAELAAGSPYYDIMYIDTPWMPALVSKVEPLSKYIADPRLEDIAKLELEDYIPKVFYDTAVYNSSKPHLHFPDTTQPLNVDNITLKGFDIYGMPISSNALVLAYRKDMFDDPKEKDAFQAKYGKPLKPADTWDEFIDVGAFFTRPENRLYGTTLMAGSGDWATDDFKTVLACWGGDGHLISDEIKMAFNTPEGVDALTFYTEMINKHKITAPGVTTFSWDEVSASFGSGLVAMAMNYGNFTLNPDVKGEIGYAMVPKKVNYGPHFGTWLMGINPYSKSKQWAYRTLIGFTSAESQTKMLQQGLNVTRVSVYKTATADAGLTKKLGNYYEALSKSLAVGVGRPRLTNYASIDEAIWTAVNNAAAGRATPSDALNTAAARVKSLLEEAGYQPS